MKIGIVLPGEPSYSETFFSSKIKGLQEKGIEVILFIGNTPLKTNALCKTKKQMPVFQSKILNLLAVISVVSYALIYHFFVASRFLKLEKKSRSSWVRCFKNLYTNYHILREKKLDWIHFGFATMAVGRENVARVLGARMAVSFRGYDISIYPVKHPGCYDLLWQKVDKVHTISNDLLEIAYNLGLSRQTPVCKITPAIDVDFFAANRVSTELHHPLQIITVARLHWKKGLEYTLQALSLLQQQGVDFRYTIIGAGEEYERLAFAAYQMGIKDQVIFAGKLSPEQVKLHLSESDIYLQYSVQEGFCNAVLEAQAMGLLCIVSDAEGLPENVLQEQTGWVVPKRKPALLAQKIIEVCNLSEEAIQKIKTCARQRLEKEFNLDKQRKAFLEFYTTS